MSSTQTKSSSSGLDFKLMKILWPYIRQGRWGIAIAFSLLLCADLLSSSIPLLIKRGIDDHVLTGDEAGLLNVVLWLLGVLLMSLITRVSCAYLMAIVGQRLLLRLRKDLLAKVFRLPKAFFDQTPTGQVLTNVTNDVESVRQLLSESLVSVTSSLSKIVFIAIFMIILSPWLALVTLCTVPIFVFGTLWFKRSLRDGFRAVRQANSDINTRMVESLNGHRELTLFQHHENNQKAFDVSNRDYLKAYRSIVKAYAIYLPVVENITHVSTLFVLVIAHFSAGSLFQAGQIFAFFSLINMFFRPLRQIAEEFNTFQSAMAATERIDKLLKQEEPIYTIKDPTRLNDRAKGLSFDKVDFAYLPGQAVLKGMSFNISSGQTVAFVGHTGAGKSTIVQLINRLYDIDQGKICVDGVALDQLDLEHWRAQVATIPQDVVIFDGTLADNLRLFDNSIQNQELEDAISGLCLNEFVDDLPLGLETPLGEAGFKLSEGQQQLVAFGRAWVKRPQLLILDEATANVDSRTERQLETALSHLKENRTTILIAHRLSTIQAADRIFVLDHGSVVESGDHQQLLKKQGLYEKLYRRQALSILVEEPIPKEMV